VTADDVCAQRTVRFEILEERADFRAVGCGRGVCGVKGVVGGNFEDLEFEGFCDGEEVCGCYRGPSLDACSNGQWEARGETTFITVKRDGVV